MIILYIAVYMYPRLWIKLIMVTLFCILFLKKLLIYILTVTQDRNSTYTILFSGNFSIYDLLRGTMLLHILYTTNFTCSRTPPSISFLDSPLLLMGSKSAPIPVPSPNHFGIGC